MVIKIKQKAMQSLGNRAMPQLFLSVYSSTFTTSVRVTKFGKLRDILAQKQNLT